MKKKTRKPAFITIFVLILLTALTITVNYASTRSQNRADSKKDFYNKRKAIYTAESVLNIGLEDKKVEENLKAFLKGMEYGDIVHVNPVEISYNGKIYLLSTTLNEVKKYIELEAIANEGNSKATACANIKLKGMEFFPKDKVDDHDIDLAKKGLFPEEGSKLREMVDDIAFKDPGLNPYDGSSEESFYETEGDLVVCKKEVQEDSPSVNTAEEDSPPGEEVQEKPPEEEKGEKIEEDKFKGILIVNGDLILKKDFDVEGLLIVKGKIKSEGDPKAKVNIKGQLIAYEKPGDDIYYLEYINRNFCPYLEDVEGFYDKEIILKKVY